jgi:hypothetical protein
MRRLGGYQTITVDLDADVSDTAGQRKVVSSDRYSIEATSPNLGQAYVWAGRYGDGTRVKQNSYARVAKARLVPPTTSNYTLKLYGYGTTATLTPASNATDIQTAIRNASASLGSVTVTGSNPYVIAGLPSSDVSVELVRATASDETGSVSQGLSSFEVLRPFSSGLSAGDVIELLVKYPAHDEPGLVGMNALINQSLERLWIPRILHFTSTDAESQQVTYALDAYPFLRSRAQIVRAYGSITWTHTYAYTVPGVSHTLSVDVGLGTAATTASISGSATSAVIEAALDAALRAAGVPGTVTVTANGTTRTVEIADAVYADMALTVSNGATVTTTSLETEPYRFTDGYRLKYEGQKLIIQWDQPWQRGYTWYLEVLQPANTYVCRQADYQTLGTTWETVSDGLEDDLDQCAVDLLEAAAVVHWMACRQLALKGGGGQESAYWRGETSRAAMIAAQIKSLDLPTASEPGFRDEGLVADRAEIARVFGPLGGW